MGIKYEVIAKAGTYESNGETKTRWHKCGVVLESSKGLSLKLESLPIVFDGWLNLWEPKAKEDAPAPKKSRGSSGFDDLDEPPF